MNAHSALVRHARDTRLYLFLGLANWFIFLDHIPNNMVSWITLRNYGFSGAAELFVFITGYTAALTYAAIMLERGTIGQVRRTGSVETFQAEPDAILADMPLVVLLDDRSFGVAPWIAAALEDNHRATILSPPAAN